MQNISLLSTETSEGEMWGGGREKERIYNNIKLGFLNFWPKPLNEIHSFNSAIDYIIASRPFPSNLVKEQN